MAREPDESGADAPRQLWPPAKWWKPDAPQRDAAAAAVPPAPPGPTASNQPPTVWPPVPPPAPMWPPTGSEPPPASASAPQASGYSLTPYTRAPYTYMTSLTSTNPLANAPVTSQDAAVACAPTRGFDVTDAKPATIAGKKGYTCRTSAGTASGSRIDFAFLSANDRLFECILCEGAGHGTYDDFVAILRSFKLLATGTTA